MSAVEPETTVAVPDTVAPRPRFAHPHPDAGGEMIDRLLTQRARDQVRLRALEQGLSALSQRAAELRTENAQLRAELEAIQGRKARRAAR